MLNLHVHRITEDDRAECLRSAEIGGDQIGEISFDPADVTEPWTILIQERDPLTVVVTLATRAQADRIRRRPADSREVLMDGIHGPVIPTAEGEQ